MLVLLTLLIQTELSTRPKTIFITPDWLFFPCDARVDWTFYSRVSRVWLVPRVMKHVLHKVHNVRHQTKQEKSDGMNFMQDADNTVLLLSVCACFF